METIKPGLQIGINRTGSDFFLSIKAVGTLTHADYEKLIPMIESALAEVKDPIINAFIDASQLEGWELRAAWDDLKLGLKHGKEFNKIAILGNKKWQEYMAKIGTWFIAGEIQYFEQASEALNWLSQK